MKKALFVTTDRYPNGDAGAVRTHAFATMFRTLGYEVTVIGMGSTTNFKFIEKDGIKYTSFRFPHSNLISRIIGRLGFYKRVKQVLENNSKWDVVIVSLVSGNVMRMLKKYCINNNIPLLHDSVEWYSPEQFLLGKLHPAYISMDLRNRKHIDKSIRVIAISTYLEKHFQSKGIITTRIPVIMDVQKISYQKITNKYKFVFTYAGSPGKKDYLDVIVKGFAIATTSNPSLSYEFRIIGITEKQLSSMCDLNDIMIIKKHLKCYGRISRDKVLEHLKETDFTVLMRSENQRYAKAGFPTKFVESLATGTPVIANATSDIGFYLKNGENGYIVSDDSSESLSRSLLLAMKNSYDRRLYMQKKSREIAEAWFDYRKYLLEVEKLINQKQFK